MTGRGYALPGRARGERNKERKGKESTKNITSPQSLHWYCCVGGAGAGITRKKVKEREKSGRGPDLLSFLDNLVQASYINQIFCPVLLMCAQPALGVLPQEVSGDRDTEHKCQGEAGSWVRTVLPHLHIFGSHLFHCNSHNV